MSKFYRCTYNQNDDDTFKVGKVYELTDKNRITGDDGYTWGPHDEGTIKWLEGKGWYKFEEVADMFILDDLKTGMLVKLRDDSIGVVMRGMVVRENEENTEKDAIVGIHESWVIELKEYSFDLKHREDCNDIMQVVRAMVYPNLDEPESEFTIRENILYDRSRVEERKRMTVEEIEKQLGYKVAIIDAEGK